jgi:hypothetical protein
MTRLGIPESAGFRPRARLWSRTSLFTGSDSDAAAAGLGYAAYRKTKTERMAYA